MSDILWNSIAPGDTLYIRGFDYRPQSLVILNKAGTPADRITVRYDQTSTGKAIFSTGVLFNVDYFTLDGFVAGPATTVTSRVTGGTQNIEFRASGSAMPKHIFSVEGGTSFTTVRGIEITKADFDPNAPNATGGDTTGARHGMSFSFNNTTEMHDNVIERCYIHHVTGDGINLNCIPDPNERYDNFIVRNNHVFHIGDDGLQGLNQDITVIGNYFDNDGQAPLHGGHPDGYQPGTGARNLIVANNTFRGFNQNVFLEFCAGDIYIYNNEMIGTRTSGTDCGIVIAISYDPSDWRSEGVRSPNNPTGVVVEATRLARFKGALVVTNNTFFNFNSSNAVRASSDVPTVINNFGVPTEPKEFVFGNNLFVNNRFVSSNEFQGNIDSSNHYFNLPGAQFYGSDGTPITPVTFVSGSALNRNPSFVNPTTEPATHNFDISDSPLISQAVDVGTSRAAVSATRPFLVANGFNADKLGRSRPQGNGWDVGAYELPQSNPGLVTQPLGQNAPAGSAVTFTVVARGATGYTLQWFRQRAGESTRTAVTTASPTHTSFTIPAVATTDAGDYTVTVTTPDGLFANSLNATLHVGTAPPTFTTHPTPANQTVATGANVTYSVAANGVPTPTFQWRKDGAPISGATGSSLVLTAVDAADAGAYTVIATNTLGNATSSAANLVVTGPPVFTTQPGNQSVSSGANVSIASLAVGTPAPTYQWHRNGTPISGATNATLTLNPVAVTNAGTYTVVATNTSGSVTSSSALLTVDGTLPPTFTTHPTSQTVTSGATVTLTAAASGPPAPTYQWKKDGANVTGATSASLVLTAVTTTNSGSYTVVATNAAGSATSNAAVLTVNAATSGGGSTGGSGGSSGGSTGGSSGGSSSSSAPVIVSHPVSQTVVAPASASFSVSATGTNLNYQWLKNGADVAGANGSTYTLASTSVTDAGSYAVRVTNLGGAVTSGSATLTVETKPTILSQPAAQTVVVGSNASFSVSAEGIPAPAFQWRKNGADIVGQTNASLSLTGVGLDAAGTYSVAVSNRNGTVNSAGAELLVNKVTVAGSYFGTFPDGGSWALVVRSDNTATYLAFLPGSNTAIVTELTIAADGSFSVSGTTIASGDPVAAQSGTPDRAAAPIPFSLTGRIVNGQVTGQLLDRPLSGSIDQGTNASAGYYKASALLTASGTTHSVVGPSGKALVLTTTPTTVDAAVGTIGANNTLTATTAGGAQLALTLTTDKSVAVTYTAPSSTSAVTFGGLIDSVQPNAALANLSIRSTAGSGSQTLIVGFAVAGGNKPMLIRGIGPALAAFNLTGTLPDPRLELNQAGASTPITTNDNWTSASGAVFAQVGAFALPQGSRDSALVVNLDASSYTAQITDASGATGVALLELYDTAAQNGGRLVNVSARSQVGGDGALLIAGFNVSGTGPRTLLIRGIGPSLAAFGVTGTLNDPRVDLFASGGTTPLASNDNWDASIQARFAQVGAFNLTSGTRDAALVVTLNPGTYTAQISGVGGATGVALVEVYELR